jgi:protein O-mannosyl-transferase
LRALPDRVRGERSMCRPATEATPAPTRAASPVTAWSLFPVWLLAVSLVLATMALYWPATWCDFVNFDDDLYLTANVQVQKGLTWEGVKWACLNPVCWNWHPLTVWSHMLARQLFGWKPWGHHLANVILHAVNTGLVFLLLRRVTGALWRSALVAALFGWHPLHVESVAWVAERKDVLSGLFGLLALMAYARYAEGRRERISRQFDALCGAESQVGPLTPVLSPSEGERENCQQPKPEAGGLGSVAGGRWFLLNLPPAGFYLLSLFLLGLGLMSKPMLVTWPCLMLLLDYWPLGRMQNAECRMQKLEASDTHYAPRNTSRVSRTTLQPLLMEKIPFFVVAALASVVTFVVQRRGGILLSAETPPLGARVGNALISYGRYLGKLFWTADLAVFYPHPGYWPLGKVLLAGALLLCISVLVWAERRRYPYLLVGWLWYCGTLVPVSQIVQTANMAMADRWTYLPSLGVLVLVVWGGRELTRGWRYQAQALSVAGSAVVVVCLALTRQQIDYWKDSETLFRHALKVTEYNWFVHNHLGAAFYKKGQTDEAIRQYREALRLNPDFAQAHNNLGMALSSIGHLDEAIRQYREALRLKADYAEAHNNLGIVFYLQSRTDEAIREFKEAIGLKPDLAEAHYNLGAALDQKGQMDEASREYQETVRLQPDYANAHYHLGVALGQKGQAGEAIRHYQEAIRLQPDYADAHRSLGIVFYQQSRIDEAIREFEEVVHLRPDHADAHNNLGMALSSKGRLDEAVSQIQEALRLERNYAEAHYNLGVALAQQGQTDEAIHQFQEALRLKPDLAYARRSLEFLLAAKARSSQPSGVSTNR